MPIPTENVGSLPRPMRPQEMIAKYDAEIGIDAVHARQRE